MSRPMGERWIGENDLAMADYFERRYGVIMESDDDGCIPDEDGMDDGFADLAIEMRLFGVRI